MGSHSKAFSEHPHRVGSGAIERIARGSPLLSARPAICGKIKTQISFGFFMPSGLCEMWLMYVPRKPLGRIVCF